MIYIPLLAIPIIYIIVAMVKPVIQKRLSFNLCAICVAVSLTWVLLLFFFFSGNIEILLIIGILMGMSISGIMYKAEGLYKKNNARNFWLVRLVIIIGGLYSVYAFLLKQWSIFILLIIILLLIIVIASLLFQKTTHSNALEEVKNNKGIIKKLEDCC